MASYVLLTFRCHVGMRATHLMSIHAMSTATTGMHRLCSQSQVARIPLLYGSIAQEVEALWLALPLAHPLYQLLNQGHPQDGNVTVYLYRN
jgi:hypothetical protein